MDPVFVGFDVKGLPLSWPPDSAVVCPGLVFPVGTDGLRAIGVVLPSEEDLAALRKTAADHEAPFADRSDAKTRLENILGIVLSILGVVLKGADMYMDYRRNR